jgi:site-specific recombinase XerD
MATMSPLRRRMIEDMTLRNLSPATRQSYVYAVAKLSRHFGCSPDQLGMAEVRAYQLHLVEQKYSWAHINQVACALRFFYGITLGQRAAFERIVTGKAPEKLPPVLNREEIARFLGAVAGLRNRVALTTAYATGLRVGEVARLKVTAIDSERICSTSRAAKAAGTATRCCRRGSWRSCALIGSRRGHACGCFPVRSRVTTSASALCNRLAERRGGGRGLPSG